MAFQLNRNYLHQCFSNVNVNINPLGMLLKEMQISNSVVLEVGPEVSRWHTKQVGQLPLFRNQAWPILVHWIVFVSPTPLPWDNNSRDGSGKENRHSMGKCLGGVLHRYYLSPPPFPLTGILLLLIYLAPNFNPAPISNSLHFSKVKFLESTEQNSQLVLAKGCIWSHRCFVLPSLFLKYE